MNKQTIGLWSLLSLVIFIICDIWMGGNSTDLIKTIIFAVVLYGVLLLAGWRRWRLAYHFLAVVIGIYALSYLIIIKAAVSGNAHIGVAIFAGLGIIVNLLWYRVAAHQLKVDYIRIVSKNLKK